MDMIQTEDGPKPLRRIIHQGWENTLGATFNVRVEPEEPAPWLSADELEQSHQLHLALVGVAAALAACKQTFADPKPATPNAKPSIKLAIAPLGAYRGLGFCDET